MLGREWDGDGILKWQEVKWSEAECSGGGLGQGRKWWRVRGALWRWRKVQQRRVGEEGEA